MQPRHQNLLCAAPQLARRYTGPAAACCSTRPAWPPTPAAARQPGELLTCPCAAAFGTAFRHHPPPAWSASCPQACAAQEEVSFGDVAESIPRCNNACLARFMPANRCAANRHGEKAAQHPDGEAAAPDQHRNAAAEHWHPSPSLPSWPANRCCCTTAAQPACTPPPAAHLRGLQAAAPPQGS